MQTFSTTLVEIRHFIRLILLSGYHRLPRERDYWNTSSDLGCSLMTKTMSRNCFHELKSYCHLADNNALGNSKLSKVQPICNKLNTAFMQFGMFHDKLSIDESMVPYYGTIQLRCLFEVSMYGSATSCGCCVHMMTTRLRLSYMQVKLIVRLR